MLLSGRMTNVVILIDKLGKNYKRPLAIFFLESKIKLHVHGGVGRGIFDKSNTIYNYKIQICSAVISTHFNQFLCFTQNMLRLHTLAYHQNKIP